MLQVTDFNSLTLSDSLMQGKAPPTPGSGRASAIEQFMGIECTAETKYRRLCDVDMSISCLQVCRV